MISEQDIQLKAQDYLKYFEQSHQQNQQKLKHLEVKVNSAAKKIQKIWRMYILKKKFKMALKIQNTWRKYYKFKKSVGEKIEKFRRVFYGGKIAYFILRKAFPSININIPTAQTPIKSLTKNNQPKRVSISFSLKKHFPSYIKLTQTYLAEQKYVQKLRVYQKQKFSQSWQKYEQTLRTQLQKQASKKWVQKNNQIWITSQNKQVNLEDYIERNVEKIFKREYEKYKVADEKLETTAFMLGEKVKEFRKQYYQKMTFGRAK